MNEINVGERFEVSEVREARDANNQLLARYLPDFGYRVTTRNKPYVDAWSKIGIATRLAPGSRGDRAFQLGTRPSTVSGKVTMSEKKED